MRMFEKALVGMCACVTVSTSVGLLRWLNLDNGILLRLVHNDVVWHRHLGSHLPFRIMRQHDFHPDAEHSLTHENVPNSVVDVVVLGFACGDEVTILELHGFGSLGAQLSADHHLTTLRAILHNESDNTVACATNSETTQEFVSQRFCLWVHVYDANFKEKKHVLASGKCSPRLCHGAACSIF